MSKKQKDVTKKSMPRSIRHGLTLVVLLAVLIMVVSVITASYSWFSPKTVKGTGIKYDTTVRFRSEDCSITHYTGAKDANGVLNYTKIANPSTVTITAGQIGYYMTNVTNNSDKYPTVVSLYISQFPEAARNVGLGIETPSNSYRTYSAQQTDLYFVRNAFITVNDNSDDATLSVEWFVDATNSSSNVTVDLSKMYIMFN